MESLDAGKAEKLPQIPHDLTKKRLPPHLWKSGAGFGAARQAPAHASCAHKSALLRMFEAVLTGSITGAEPPPSCPEMWLDPDLAVYVSGPGSAPFLSDAKHVELERKWEQLLSRCAWMRRRTPRVPGRRSEALYKAVAARLWTTAPLGSPSRITCCGRRQ
jgi:hypothetical protein